MSFESGKNNVDHPSHYTSSPACCLDCGRRIECIDVIEHMPANIANAMKYLWRCGLKGDAVEDLRKAEWYIRREISLRTRQSRVDEVVMKTKENGVG